VISVSDRPAALHEVYGVVVTVLALWLTSRLARLVRWPWLRSTTGTSRPRDRRCQLTGMIGSVLRIRKTVPLKLAADFVTVTRPHKFIPFLLVLLNAQLLSTSQVDWPDLFCTSLFVLASCSFGMRINAWTDRELDQSTKPELYYNLSQSFKIHFFAVALESTISFACLVFLIRGEESAGAIWLALFGLLFSLYSFNYLVPRRGKKCRLKIYWWGNLLSAGGGYFALWMAGLSSKPGNLDFRACLFLAFFCASFEYAVFLGECATDAEQEKIAALQTLPAVLGRSGAVFAAWISCLLLAISWFVFGRAWIGDPFGDWYAISSLTICSGFLYFARMTHSPILWDKFADLSFWIIRLGALMILLFTQGA
jgi:4-hydroxybenzoate polyprenyltransferase